MERKTLRVREAAAQVGIGLGACYTLIRSGHLHSVRVGRKILIPQSAIDEFLKPSRFSQGGEA